MDTVTCFINFCTACLVPVVLVGVFSSIESRRSAEKNLSSFLQMFKSGC